MKRVFIAAGGSGGHIFPGLAVAEKIKNFSSEVEVHFVGAKGEMEERIIPQQGYSFHGLPIERLNSNARLIQRLKGMLFLPVALILSLYLVIRYRPQVVLGVGGFASGPFVLMSALCRVPSYIWEANAYPGMANRYLSRFVEAAFILFDRTKNNLKSKKYFKFGYPLRKKIEELKDVKKNKVSVERKVNVLVFGGSQGSALINKAIQEMLVAYPDMMEKVNLVHQVGRYDFERCAQFYGEKKWPIQFYKFIDDMEKKYIWADVVICRAGIGTVCELSVLGLPAIFIPLASAADDHQKMNAEVLVEAKAGEMILQKDLTAESLYLKLKSLISSPDYLNLMSENAKTFYVEGAAEKMAVQLFEHCGVKK